MSLPEALEAAASALEADADAIRPANGDPRRLLELLSDEAAQRVLAWLFANRPTEAEELAHEWETDERGAYVLIALDERALPKEGRKVLRKARHRLRSRGVAVAEEGPVPRVAALGRVDEELRGAWLTPIDPVGARMIVLVEPQAGGGSRLLEVILDDARGILSFEAFASSRGRVRRFLKKLAERGPEAAVEVPEAALQAVVARALEAQPRDRALPRGFAEWRSRLSEAPADARLPGAEVREALGEEVEDGLLERSVELLESGRIGPWPPPRERLAALFERLRSTLESPVIVSPAARREQMEGVFADAAEEIFDEAGAALAAHRFRETAYVAWRRGDLEEARACLAAAASFERGGVRENPVALAMLRVPLGPAMAELAGEAPAPLDEATAAPDADPPRIVTP